jgi:putative sugar O-methyltransferase
MYKRIQESYLKAKAQQMPPVFQPSMEWEPQISEKQQVWMKVIQENNLKGTLDNFFRNQKLTHGIWNIPTTYHIKELKNLEIKQIEELHVPEYGNPKSASIGFFSLDEENHLLLEYKAKVTFGTVRFYVFAKKTMPLLEGINRPVVIELGGGYGGYAYSLMKKQKSMVYINLDLPDLLPMSSYYLMKAYPDKKTLLYDEYKPGMDLTGYDMVFLPNWEITNISDESADLFVNFRSMGEMKMETIKEYLGQINRILKYERCFYQENTGQPMPTNSRGYRDTPILECPYPATLEVKDMRLSPYHDGYRYWEAICVKEKIIEKYQLAQSVQLLEKTAFL